MPNIDEQARAVLLKILEVEPIPGDIRREDNPAWNSLKHVDLIFLIEDEFGIELTEDEMSDLDSLSGIVALVESRRAA
jgi:acyl carrier protein